MCVGTLGVQWPALILPRPSLKLGSHHLSGVPVPTGLVPEVDEQRPLEGVRVTHVVLLQSAHLGMADVSVGQKHHLQGLGTEESGHPGHILITQPRELKTD